MRTPKPSLPSGKLEDFFCKATNAFTETIVEQPVNLRVPDDHSKNLNMLIAHVTIFCILIHLLFHVCIQNSANMLSKH